MGLESEIKKLDSGNGLHEISDEELKRIQRKLLSMLVDLDAFCRAQRIEWGLIGGSVIGAVRHHGFIPWDDDVDVFMTRENYNRFREAFLREKPAGYLLCHPGDEGYYCHFPRVCDTGTYLHMIQSAGKGPGLHIDIFVLDDIPDNALARLLHGLKSTFYLFVISTMVTRHQREDLMRYGTPALRRKVRIRNLLSLPFRFRKAEAWIARGTGCFSAHPNPKSRFVVSATGGGHYFHEIFLREKMCRYMDAEFEGHTFPIMEGYDHFLSLRYGADYMTPPPKEKWEHHAVIGINLDGGAPR